METNLPVRWGMGDFKKWEDPSDWKEVDTPLPIITILNKQRSNTRMCPKEKKNKKKKNSVVTVRIYQEHLCKIS